jgi:hypothetical protein
MKKFTILTFSLFSFLTVPALATNYYVSPSGNDNNPGTFSQPFKTIQKGINSAYAGDTVFVREGTYNIGSTSLTMQRSGSPGSPIVFINYPNEHPIIQTTSANSPERTWNWGGYKDYLVIDGFEIIGGKYAVLVQGDYNQIRNLKAHDTGSDGVCIWGGSYNLYHKVEVWNTGWNGLYIESRPNDGSNGNANYNTIEYCYSHDIGSHFGINIFPNTQQSQNPMIGNVIRYNIVNNCKGGMYLRSFQDGEVYGNLIVNDGTNGNNGIFLHSESGGGTFQSNTKFYNNTLIDNTQYWSVSNDVFSHTEWKNNLFIQHYNGSEVKIERTTGTALDYNLYWNPNYSTIVRWNGNYYSLSQLSSIGQETHGIDADPLLNSDYTLSANSPAKDAGVNLGAPYNYDMFGNLRGSDGYWDMGAFEFTGAGGGGNSPPNQPANPSPPSGSNDQPLNLNLTWQCSDPDGDPLLFDVYFGTNSNPPLVQSNQSSFSYNPGSLNYSTTYYWKIVAKDNQGHSTSGSIWNFTTIGLNNNPPNQPNTPTPENNSINQQTLLNLSWLCSDPDNDPLTYDVYFGTAANPPLLVSGITSNTYNPGQLNQSTTYFWKIVAKDNQTNSTSGPIWNFTTFSGGGDTIAPRLVGVEVLNNNSIKLSFSENILGGNQAANFAISNNITVNQAQYSNLQTTLTTSYHTPGQYEVTVSNITDLSGNLIDPDYNSLNYEVSESSQLIQLAVVDVTASVIPEADHTPDKTIDGKGYYDGDPDSRWAGDTMPEWLCFDIGSELLISRAYLEFYNWHIGRIYNYTLQVSSDTLNWITVVSNENSLTQEWTVKDFSPVNARYLKIIFNSNNQNDWAGLWEAQIWGEGPTNQEDPAPLPNEFELLQNYPNPFNPSTKIKFSVAENSLVQLKVYNLIGELVADLIDENLEKGTYEVEFNAENLSSGIYIYVLRANEFISTKKMVLLQ